MQYHDGTNTILVPKNAFDLPSTFLPSSTLLTLSPHSYVIYSTYALLLNYVCERESICMNAKAEICYYCISGLKFWHQSYTSIIYFSCYKFENKDSKIVVTGYTDAVKSFDDKSLTF